MKLFEVTFRPNGSLNESCLDCVKDYEEEYGGLIISPPIFYISGTSNDSVSCTIDVDPASHAPMSTVASLARDTHVLLTELIMRVDSKFKVTTLVDDEALQGFMNAIPQEDAVYDSSSGGRQANRQTILDIANWLRTVAPVYEKCFITPELFKGHDEFGDDDKLYSSSTQGFQSIEEALAADNSNMIVISPYEKGILNRKTFGKLFSGGNKRTPCKVQGSLRRRNLLRKHVYIDIQKAGLTLNHFVHVYDFINALHSDSRVFAVIPSFERYAGLVSDGVLAGEDVTSSMHCGVGLPPMYQMSFMFECGVSKDLVLPEGKLCVSNDNFYKTRSPTGVCDWPMKKGRKLDTECCVAPIGGRFLKTILTIYARKTQSDGNYIFLDKIYKWYVETKGKIKPHDAEVTTIFPTDVIDDVHITKALIAMRPVLKVFHIYSPDAVGGGTFVDWYDKVNSAFMIRDQFIMKLSLSPEHKDETIDVEHMKRVVANRPKSELHLELSSAYFHNIDNLAQVLLAVYATEHFYMYFFWTFYDTEGTSSIYPTNAITKAGFVENEEEQILNRDEDDRNKYHDIRVFEKGHMTVSMERKFSQITLELRTGHAFS